ncbi:MAG TPA: hypothetical protein DCP53_09890 [Elusimicrobia bacterium]|nr:MAG: hypothetical protein A2551_07315 [Elusimicrobia bacterium RIFOXYD2_FULL_34_30]HAM39685.1 hypothetical protein [Elusimicrobiota bacterium]
MVLRKEVKKAIQWTLFFLIIAIIFFTGLNRLIDALIHSKKDQIVPNIIGKNIVDALDTLSSLNLYLKKTGEVFNSELQAGLVISQTPVSGSIVKEGRAIKVIVSAGGEVIFVPDLTNQTVRSAQLILRKNSLDLGEQEERYSNNIAKGNIMSQNPMPRTSARKDGLVNIIVSHGPPPPGTILMPDFKGKSFFEAQEWCNNNDIIIQNIDMVNDPTLEQNSIIKHVPGTDMVISTGQPVRFWIATRQEQ